MGLEFLRLLFGKLFLRTTALGLQLSRSVIIVDMVTNCLASDQQNLCDLLRRPTFIVEQNSLNPITYSLISLSFVLKLKLLSFLLCQKVHENMMPSNEIFVHKKFHSRRVYILHIF